MLGALDNRGVPALDYNGVRVDALLLASALGGGGGFDDFFIAAVVFGSADPVAVSQKEVALIRELRDKGTQLYNQHMGGSGTGAGKIPVLCRTTGETFADTKAAAAHFGLHPTVVASGLLTGKGVGNGRKRGKIFRCLETGETWEGLQAWCTAHGLVYQSMFHRLRNGGEWLQYTYESIPRQELFFEWA